METINLEEYIRIAINKKDKYLKDVDDITALKEVARILRTNRASILSTKKEDIKINAQDIPLLVDPSNVLLTAKVTNKDVKKKILLLLRAKEYDKDKVDSKEEDIIETAEEPIIDEPTKDEEPKEDEIDLSLELELFINIFKGINIEATIDVVKGEDNKPVLVSDTSLDMLRFPSDKYYFNEKNEICVNDKPIIAAKYVKKVKNKDEETIDESKDKEPAEPKEEPTKAEPKVDKPFNKFVIEIRKKREDESLIEYEEYLEENYKNHGITIPTIDSKIRSRYPHEKEYTKNAGFTLNGEKYKIIYEEGTTSKDYIDYYKKEYLKSKQKKAQKLVSSKEKFLSDIDCVHNVLDTTIDKFKMTELNEILDIISADNTPETSEEETYNISFNGTNFSRLINRNYVFKISKESYGKLTSLGYVEKYFNNYKAIKTKEPIKSIIRIQKRKDESIADYEAYIESVYSEYPSLFNRDAEGKIISPRKKLPHELHQDQFIVDGKIIEIQYGNPDDPRDMEDLNKNREKYISSIREFYTKYYKTFKKQISDTPKLEKNKKDLIDALKEVYDNKDNISCIDVNEAEIETLIRALSEDTTKEDENNNVYFLKVSGANLIYKSNYIFQFTISSETYKKVIPLLNKYFGNMLKEGFKNTDKNLYIKTELQKRYESMPQKRDALLNQQYELLEKAIALLAFDATTETDLVELVGAVIPRSKKDEFLKVMRQIEATGFRLDNFVPVEMPPHYNGSSPRSYERDLVDRYKYARSDYYNPDSKEYIFDTTLGKRHPYPHEIFKWTEDNQPSISTSNNESEHYRYYVDYGCNALMKRSKVTSKENIHDKPKLLQALSDKLNGVREKLMNVPVLNLMFDNDLLRAMSIDNIAFKDVEYARSAYRAFTEKIRNYSIVGAAIVFLSPQVTIGMGIVGVGTLVVGHSILDSIIRIRNCYDSIKVSKCDEYSKCLEELTKDIVALERQINEMDGAPASKASAERKRSLLENLKSKIVIFRKTQKKFNQAFNKLSKKTINDWQDEEEAFRDTYDRLTTAYSAAESEGGMSI